MVRVSGCGIVPGFSWGAVGSGLLVPAGGLCWQSRPVGKTVAPGVAWSVVVRRLPTAHELWYPEVRTVLTPREQLADTLKQARVAAGYATHGALAKKLNVSRPVITRAENPSHPVPSDAVLAAWAGATGAPLDALTDLAARSKSGTPDWFMPYRVAESAADTLRSWAVTVLPGLLQCEAYVRALLAVEPYPPERLDELVAARLERQEVLKHAYLTAILDYSVLQRPVGSAAVMAEQCGHLLYLATRPNIRLHVLPEGVNLATWGAFDLAAKDGMVTCCLTTLQDVTSTSAELVGAVLQAYERLLGSAMAPTDSLDFVRGMEDQWKQRI
jgi:transcriptional regulator with XRE-family HTH domain